MSFDATVIRNVPGWALSAFMIAVAGDGATGAALRPEPKAPWTRRAYAARLGGIALVRICQ